MELVNLDFHKNCPMEWEGGCLRSWRSHKRVISLSMAYYTNLAALVSRSYIESNDGD